MLSYSGYGIIYKITNILNDKCYIGRTRTKFNTRYSGGQWWLYTSSIHLKRSALLHGKDNFTVEILKICASEDELSNSEGECIELYKAVSEGYNTLDYKRSYSETNPNYVHLWSDKEKAEMSQKLTEVWATNTDLQENHRVALIKWWETLSEEKLNAMLEKRAETKATPEWREYLSQQIKAGHAKRTPESKTSQYANAALTRETRDPNKVKADYAARAAKRKLYYESLSPEQREQQRNERNQKISATLLARETNDYAARVAKRLNRSPDEIELSEVKRILDRFGSSWSPGARSKWHGNVDKFHALAATLTTLEKKLPIVIIVGGQCGVGKSWVCKQLLNCVYISYDKARESSYQLIEAAIRDGKVVVFETPIRSKTHAKRLSEKYQVYYTVVTADEETVAARLVGRGSTRLNNVAKMNVKYKKYANVAWFAGSSCWMLTQLQRLIDSVGPVSSTTSQV